MLKDILKTSSMTATVPCVYDKKFSYRRGTARRPKLVEILSTAAQLYEKSFKKDL